MYAALSPVYKRFVEIGRVVLLIAGPNKGKIAVISDVVDQTKVLVNGPETGVARSIVSLKSVALTNFKITIPHSSSSASISKVWKKEDVTAKWAQTAWAKKLAARKVRAGLNDFQRFVVKINKKKRAQFINSKVKAASATKK